MYLLMDQLGRVSGERTSCRGAAPPARERRMFCHSACTGCKDECGRTERQQGWMDGGMARPTPARVGSKAVMLTYFAFEPPTLDALRPVSEIVIGGDSQICGWAAGPARCRCCCCPRLSFPRQYYYCGWDEVEERTEHMVVGAESRSLFICESGSVGPRKPPHPLTAPPNNSTIYHRNLRIVSCEPPGLPLLCMLTTAVRNTCGRFRLYYSLHRPCPRMRGFTMSVPWAEWRARLPFRGQPGEHYKSCFDTLPPRLISLSSSRMLSVNVDTLAQRIIDAASRWECPCRAPLTLGGQKGDTLLVSRSQPAPHITHADFSYRWHPRLGEEHSRVSPCRQDQCAGRHRDRNGPRCRRVALLAGAATVFACECVRKVFI